MHIRTPFGSAGWETTLLYSVLLLHVIPLFTHDTSSFLNAVAARRDSEGGGSVLFNTIRFNSSTSRGVAVTAALPGEATPISQGQVLVRKPRWGEESGSGGPAEVASPDSSAHLAMGGMGAGLPTRSSSRAHGRAQLDFKEEDSAPHWQSEILQADGSVLALNQRPPLALAKSEHTLHSLDSPGDDQVINVGFNDPDQGQGYQISTPPPSSPEEPTFSIMTDFYNFIAYVDFTTEASPDEDLPTPVYVEDEIIFANRRPFAPEHAATGSEGGDSSACLPGFMNRNGTCQSPCDSSSSYCFNGGKCYTTATGAFCWCNMQNYIWSKGSRCESVITDFQVMCFVVGGTSATVLLIFMVIVVFSKRLHLLKMENRRLRKCSRSRPQSEQHGDTFSLSTAAEGSQTNKTMSRYTWECTASTPKEELCGEDDTGKQEKPVQTPTKEDEALNIHNSLTPKQEEMKASCEDAEEGSVAIDLELLLLKEAGMLLPEEAELLLPKGTGLPLPNDAELHPETRPQVHCNVFICELPKSPPKSPVLRRQPGRCGQGRPLSQVYPRQGCEPMYSCVSTRSLPSLPPSSASPCLGEHSTA